MTPNGAELSWARKLVILASYCLSLLIVTMDVTIVNVAIPSIRAEFDAAPAHLQWVIDIYTLALALLLTAFVVPESRSATMRSFDPIGQIRGMATLFGIVHTLIGGPGRRLGSSVDYGPGPRVGRPARAVDRR